MQQQTDIFDLAKQYPHFAELCNALYERELMWLSQNTLSDQKKLSSRLAGLPYHIRNAAEYLLSKQAPIGIDVHNGSWQAKQASKNPATKVTPSNNHTWFDKYSRHGLIVCVSVNEYDNEHIELDSVDILPPSLNKLHLNKFGWFTLSGESTESSKKHVNIRLLKPSKTLISAACCGHAWTHKGKTTPRALSLRELLLSTKINWKTFK